jgi:hypothetical protein
LALKKPTPPASSRTLLAKERDCIGEEDTAAGVAIEGILPLGKF